jgi:hypothetical protein
LLVSTDGKIPSAVKVRSGAQPDRFAGGRSVSKDLIGKDQIGKDQIGKDQRKDESTLTEVQKATQSLAEMMLFGAEAPPCVEDHPSIILAIDYTSSMGPERIEERRITAEAARSIAYSLLAQLGTQVLLAFFRGDGHDRSAKHPRQLKFSKVWYSAPEELAQAIMKIEHWAGWTQHCRLLRHVVEEANKRAIQRVVIISDAFEQQTPLRPDGDDLLAARVHARRLRNLGTEVVFGFKGIIRGACPLDRAGVNAEQAFRDIASEAGGYVFPFDPATIADRFAEIATQAAFAAKGDAAGPQKLLEHLQSAPFEMTVGEQVPNSKCQSQSES